MNKRYEKVDQLLARFTPIKEICYITKVDSKVVAHRAYQLGYRMHRITEEERKHLLKLRFP
jgi:hypothetical protein